MRQAIALQICELKILKKHIENTHSMLDKNSEAYCELKPAYDLILNIYKETKETSKP